MDLRKKGADFPKITDLIVEERATDSADAADATDTTIHARLRLKKLLNQGFYPKNLLFAHHNDKDLTKDELMIRLKELRIAFLSADMDKYRKIFKNRTYWYYIPLLCLDMDTGLTESHENQTNCTTLSFSYESPMENPMPLLAGLLYEFCFPISIKISAFESSGNLGKIAESIKIDPNKKDLLAGEQ